MMAMNRSGRSLFVAALGVALAQSCTLTTDLPSEAATGGQTTTTSMGGQGGHQPECALSSDCPGQESVCAARTCDEGVCGQDFTLQNAATASQIEGDCKQQECDGAGNVVQVPLETDLYDDGLECTIDSCSAENMPISEPVTDATPCAQATGYCLSGQCVECIDVAHCSTKPGCANSACVCDVGNCVLLSCQNLNLDVGETDVDCGGDDCNPCADGYQCLAPSDCTSGVCVATQGAPPTCAVPSCTDSVQNGTEPDVDCGSTCPNPCADGQSCNLPSDCSSGVCSGNACAVPTCLDGVKNGSETGIDCGGGDCPKCGQGSGCSTKSDCATGLVCSDGICTGATPMRN